MADAQGAEAPIAEVAPGLHQLVSGVELPAELFHYTGAEGVLGILESGVLRATRIDYLNDSAEYQAGLALARTAIAEIRDEDPQCQELLDQLEEHLGVLADLSCRVSCFSEEGDLLSQWRGYAGGYGGYNLGFDPWVLAALCQTQRRYLLSPCVYAVDRGAELLRTAIEGACSRHKNHEGAVNERGVPMALIHGLIDVGGLAAFIKHASFMEECEWRLVCVGFDADAPDKYRATPTALVPYSEFRLGEADGRSPIVSARVGPNPHTERAQATLKSCLKAFGYQKATVSRSASPYRAW